MKLFSKTKLFIVPLCIMLLAVGCNNGKKTKQDIELVIWQPFASRQALDPIIQDFENANRGVRVTVVDKEVTGYETKLLDSLAASNGPDIFAINNAWLPEYLDKVAPAPESLWKFVDFRDAFVNVVSDDFTRGTSIYGTAFSVDALALYYNKAILADAGVYTPPATWGEFQNAVRKITRQNDVGYFSRSGAAMGHSSLSSGGSINRAEDILYLLATQTGGQGFKADGSQAVFGNSIQKNGKSLVPMVEALRFYTSFARADSQNYNWNAQSDYSIDAFANGRAAMMLNYSYVKDTLKKKNPSLSFGVALAPQESTTAPAINFANYWGQVVSKQSKNSEMAWKFLQFATSKDNLSKYLAVAKQPSSRKDLLEAQTSDPEIGTFAHAVASAKSFFRPHSEDIDKVFAGAIDAVIFKGLTPDAAVAQALRQAQSLLQKKN